jgi:hypothetical protein
MPRAAHQRDVRSLPKCPRWCAPIRSWEAQHHDYGFAATTAKWFVWSEPKFLRGIAAVVAHELDMQLAATGAQAIEQPREHPDGFELKVKCRKNSILNCRFWTSSSVLGAQSHYFL